MTTITKSRLDPTGRVTRRTEGTASQPEGPFEIGRTCDAASGPSRDRGATVELGEAEWVGLPGGELEVPRPRVRCAACRTAVGDAATRRPSGELPICFACYRADRVREQALLAAKHFDTASPARFAEPGAFEPVNRARLARLRAERLEARRLRDAVDARFGDRRRSAQLSARRALQLIAEGLRTRCSPPPMRREPADQRTPPLPESWLPFVASH